MPPKEPDDLPAEDVAASPRVTLPKNLAATLMGLDVSELYSLRTHVDAEIKRREKQEKVAAPAASRARSADLAAIPLGKRSLILASSRAGMKPQAIAKALRISLSAVTRVLGEGGRKT